jgi:aspartate/methionine/tyrosine aminotransferase
MALARPLAARVAALKPSATVEMTERLRAARAAGRKILSLSSGDPNIDTDPRIIEAAHRAMLAGDTRYAPAPGILPLREAIVEREARHGAQYTPADILVTPGGKFALLAALMGTVSTDDEVIIPEPGWVSYGPCVQMCGGKPVILPMLDSIDLAALERAITPRTVAIILNSPVNPTGRVLPPAEVQGVLELAERHNLWLIFDQVYADLLHVAPFTYPQATEAGHARTLVVDSFSKTFGMTGWRLGYLALPTGMAKTVQRFLQHSVYCVPGFIQAAGVTALGLFDEVVPQYRETFRRRQLHAAERLNAIPGVKCEAPGASFYLFPSVQADDSALAARWLDTLNVSTLPGSAFGATGAGHLRLSVTSDDAEIDAALDLISKAGLAV